ncbi:MAG: M48 family metallopeptidase [Bacteroidaceae bacterium]|nr:M48 family metallopeptidase [Bacteroidaceae bacterium]
MQYVGVYSQIKRNNIYSVLLLFAFPAILLGMVWLFLAIMNSLEGGTYDQYGNFTTSVDYDVVNYSFLQAAPWVVGGVAIWFCIAYFFNAQMVRSATGARPLERKENKRVYNIVENLCISCGMDMPKIYVVDDPQLNAFASGIDKNSYAVTLTTGILELLDDEELAGVVGHELTHIRNRDTRLLITSIIFVGIVSTLLSLVFNMVRNMFWFGGGSSSERVSFSSNRNDKNKGVGILIAFVVGAICLAIAYVFILLTRFAISRKREYMADAGGAELCRNPLALASALRKISGDPGLQHCTRDDIAQLFIIHPQSLSGKNALSSMFSTHPDVRKRIEILEQF